MNIDQFVAIMPIADHSNRTGLYSPALDVLSDMPFSVASALYSPTFAACVGCPEATGDIQAPTGCKLGKEILLRMCDPILTQRNLPIEGDDCATVDNLMMTLGELMWDMSIIPLRLNCPLRMAIGTTQVLRSCNQLIERYE